MGNEIFRNDEILEEIVENIKYKGEIFGIEDTKALTKLLKSIYTRTNKEGWINPTNNEIEAYNNLLDVPQELDKYNSLEKKSYREIVRGLLARNYYAFSTEIRSEQNKIDVPLPVF